MTHKSQESLIRTYKACTKSSIIGKWQRRMLLISMSPSEGRVYIGSQPLSMHQSTMCEG